MAKSLFQGNIDEPEKLQLLLVMDQKQTQFENFQPIISCRETKEKRRRNEIGHILNIFLFYFQNFFFISFVLKNLLPIVAAVDYIPMVIEYSLRKGLTIGFANKLRLGFNW